ncbi:MAG: MOSC domain-containing protein [Chloroflexota bacterium]
MMQIVSINIGKAQAIEAKSGQSGIFKYPVTKAVAITEEGLEHDVIVDTENHGGKDQAVYIYGMPDYTWWSAELGRELKAGTFGENITISELESASLCIGDRLRMGDVLLEITSPRIPCVTLATRMDDPQFVKKFLQAGRYGAYCRVIETGSINTEDAVILLPYDGERVSINELADAFYAKEVSEKQIKRFLSVPIIDKGRDHYQSKLEELT